MSELLNADEAIRRAHKLVQTFGWPTMSPMEALRAIEKKMPPGDPQIQLMWLVCTHRAHDLRKAQTGLHPIIEIHVHESQTAEGISEYLLDCADAAKAHPLNGVHDAPPP